MNIYELIEKLEDIAYSNNEMYGIGVPTIYIQLNGCEIPLENVEYIPEDDDNFEAIVLS